MEPGSVRKARRGVFLGFSALPERTSLQAEGVPLHPGGAGIAAGSNRTPSHKRENDDPCRYQGGHAGDGDAEINTADEGVLRLDLDLTVAHCTSPCSYPVPHT